MMDVSSAAQTPNVVTVEPPRIPAPVKTPIISEATERQRAAIDTKNTCASLLVWDLGVFLVRLQIHTKQMFRESSYGFAKSHQHLSFWAFGSLAKSETGDLKRMFLPKQDGAVL